MLDNRIQTFLVLCQEMNYRKTAQRLLMTQPAVTQHIQGLEALYQCKLFHYEGKTLHKTPQAQALEVHARSMMSAETSFRKELATHEALPLSVGATKTVGDYVANRLVMNWLENPRIALTFVVDNTQRLFEQLHTFQLDFLMIEGYFDKSQYAHRLIRKEELVGICAPSHPFAQRDVPLSEVFQEHLLLRESGSGTRQVFEHFLTAQNASLRPFQRISVISSFALIQEAVAADLGISFVYQAIPEKNPELATFRIADHPIFHELNYVFLKNTTLPAWVLPMESERPPLGGSWTA